MIREIVCTLICVVSLVCTAMFLYYKTPTVDTGYVCERLEKCLVKKSVTFTADDKESCLAAGVEKDDVHIVSAFILDCHDLPDDCAFILCMHEHSTARFDAINRLSNHE
jgi:hypothetical protein